MGNAVLSKNLAELAAIDFGIQAVGWAVASALHTEKFYDVAGSLTYWTLVLRARSFASRPSQAKAAGENAKGVAGDLSLRQQFCSLAVLAWSLRLGLFLAKRAYQYGDSRFDKVKHKPRIFLIYWMIQGVWCFLTALPVYLQLSRDGPDTKPTGIIDILSWTGWSAGFVIEVVADMQKSAWKAAGNQGFVDTGIWRYSQHPNYFGEMLLWASLCISCINGQGKKAWVSKLASLASPSFVIYLLRFVSGVPMLQKAAQQKYGTNADYLAYIARTNLLVPWIPRS